MSTQKILYLTIDDSPSERSDALLDILKKREILATFFVIGDRLANTPEPMIRAIQDGHILGNHLYHHRRSSEISYEDIIEEIEQTEALIEECYTKAGVERPYKLLRFPHMDRGCGAHVVDYDAYPAHKTILQDIFLGGVRVDQNPPPPPQDWLEKKAKLQTYLKEQGFTQPFYNLTHAFFAQTEMAQAYDCLYSFSTADWMISSRHKGKWDLKTLDDVLGSIDQSEHLNDPNSADIILMHDDYKEDTLTNIDAILGHFQNVGMRFMLV